MTARHWSEREPDEDVEDWMLRLQVSQMITEAHALGLVPIGRKIPVPERPRDCGECHAGECVAEHPFTTTARGA